MASLFDVMDALQTMALDATSVLPGRIVDVAQGWPQPNDVDTAVAAGRTLVSIFQVPSTTSSPPQPMNWNAQVIAAPVHGLSTFEAEDGFTLAGTPGVGEYVTLILNGRESFSAVAAAGDLPQGLIANLASRVGPRATAQVDTLTLSDVGSFVVRIGAPGTLGEFLHRQSQQFRIVVWAPSPADRAAVATAVDIVLKANLTFTLPDTSEALLTYQTLNLDDRYAVNGCYRADLIWSVTWDTFGTLPGYEVTSFEVTLNPGPSATTVAI